MGLILAAAACTDGPERRVVPPSGGSGSEPAQGSVCINEVNTRDKYIELHNPTDRDADLSGFRIRKNNSSFLQNADKTGDFAVAQGTVLPARGFAVLDCKGAANDHEGIRLGTSATGISGSKSLLLELVDGRGERLDWFVNSPYPGPRAVDAWDADVEHAFDVAGRMGDAGAGWYVLRYGTPGRSNADAGQGAAFVHTEIDFEATEPNAPGEGQLSYSQALAYVFDMEALPEIRVEVSEAEWNRLLAAYDRDSNTEEYIRCRASFTKDGQSTTVDQAGLRLRGNTSRRRPEGGGGAMHDRKNPDWHHCHFMLNLRKFVKDDAHTVKGVRKIHLKWFKDDPTYAREIYCFDLFRRYGIPTTLNSSYCRLRIRITEDEKDAYYGVYAMLEAIDDEYLEARETLFGDARHFLWKCAYGADLSSADDARFGADQGTGAAYAYELKTNTDDFAAAKAQLQDFIAKLNGKSGESFRSWIAEVCDVELLLRTYAVNVAVGMWDDYWNNSNNYYLYFNSADQYAYRVFLIPYDYDNTLGTSHSVGVQSDSGRQDPLRWGSESNPLIHNILQYEPYRAIYLNALRELCTDDRLFGMQGSVARILKWQAMTAPFVANDTGEDCSIYDAPAAWGNHPEYRVTGSGPDNFFSVKAASIPQ